MKALFSPKLNLETSSTRASMALLIARVLIGTAFLIHGSSKIINPFAWMGADAPVPAIFQGLAALSEFGGGIALILGLFTPLASLGIIVTMCVAVITHVGRGDGFVGGYEPALEYLGMVILIFLLGPGRFSVDAFLSKMCTKKSSR